MSTRTAVWAVIGVVIGYYVVAHFGKTGQAA